MSEGKQRSRAARLGLEVLGWVLVVAGIAALVLPGPGLLLLAAGLYVHSLSYEWAANLLEPVKRQAFRTAAESVETWPRIVFSAVLALCVSAAGVVWGMDIDAPGWWPLDEDWWLVGGWGTGGVLIASGIVALGLIVWSYRTFRIQGGTIEEVLEEHGLDSD